MKKIYLVFITFIFVIGVALGGAPFVCAQETDFDEFTLEEITVTAEKREADLQKTPVSIQTYSGEELTTEAKHRIDEIMQGVVGVQTQGSQVGTDFYMRGLGTADFGPPVWGANQSAVAVLIDGIYQNRGEVVRGGTLDMARVEVMRGTQSTTLGGASLAGAVSLVLNEPVLEEYEGSGSVGFGDYHSMTIQGVLNAPLAENQALRIAYSTEKRDGYLSSNAGNSDQHNGRIKYRWQPDETVNLVATVSKQVIGGNGVDMNSLSYYGYWEGYNEANAGSYDATMGYPLQYGHLDGVKYDERDNPWDDGMPADQWPNNVFRHSIINQYSVDMDWDLSIGTLTLIPSYQTASFNSQETPRGSQSDGEGWNAEKRKQKTAQFDAQLTSSADASLEWLAGLYYYDTRFTGEMYSANFSEANSFYDWESTNPTTQTTHAAYGKVTYPVLDVIRLIGGLRYARDEKSDRRNRARVLGTAAGPSGPYVYDRDLEATWKETTYRVGAEYDVSDQAMVYALFATGYMPGTWDGGGNATGSQLLDQYTAGLKSRFFGNRLQLNAEGFHSTYFNRNLQGGISYYSDNYRALSGNDRCNQPPMVPGQPPPPPSPGAEIDYDNDLGYACVDVGQGATVPELYSMGVDLEINWLITGNDRLDASAEYLKSEQGKPVYGVTQSDLEDNGMSEALATAAYNGMETLANSYDGLTLQNSPEWSANLSYSHIFEMPGGSVLTPKLNMEYRDTYWSRGGGPPGDIAQPGEAIQDAYSLYNFYLNWTSSEGKFNISAYIRNIEDKPILTNYGSEGMSTVTLAPPRTMGMVFSVNF